MPEDHLSRDDLEPGDFAMLDQNWSRANAELDELLELNREHRQAGCPHWYCGDEKLANRLFAYEPHEVHMIMRAAMERLT